MAMTRLVVQSGSPYGFLVQEALRWDAVTKGWVLGRKDSTDVVYRTSPMSLENSGATPLLSGAGLLQFAPVDSNSLRLEDRSLMSK